MTDAADMTEAEKRRAALEARLAAQDVALDGPREVQEMDDLEAFAAARELHGVNNIARLFVPYTPGLPTFALAHTPNPTVVKRYRDMIRPQEGKIVNASIAAEAACTVVLVYPDETKFAEMCAARPGLKAQLGMAALNLASASETASGKG